MHGTHVERGKPDMLRGTSTHIMLDTCVQYPLEISPLAS